MKGNRRVPTSGTIPASDRWQTHKSVGLRTSAALRPTDSVKPNDVYPHVHRRHNISLQRDHIHPKSVLEAHFSAIRYNIITLETHVYQQAPFPFSLVRCRTPGSPCNLLLSCDVGSYASHPRHFLSIRVHNRSFGTQFTHTDGRNV